MSNINIDKLQLEVESSSEKAEKSLDKFISKLDKLQSTIQKCSGMEKISKQIDKISSAINSASGFEKIERLCSALDKFQNLKAPNVTKTVNAIKKLTSACNSVGDISNIEQLKSNIEVISEACKPMENMGKNTLAPFLNTLKKLPEITNSLDTKTLETFAERIKQITSAITPLTNAVAKSQTGLVALNDIVKATTASNGNLASSNAAATRSFTSLGSIINSVKVKAAAFVLVARRIGSVIADCLDSSNAYVENLNLFSVSMGDAAQSALEYAQEVNRLLGIDVSDWIRNQGVFKQIASGFGVVTEKANLMSKNLTQIGYDIASFFNISVEDAMQKVQSGISGELEPLRRLGYALDAATLQQIAYSNGITQNINTMTQAQKSQLRYIAILQQSTNVMGDMARTVVTPANSMRILNQQIEQMKRAFGNVVSVIAVKVIPYLQVAIRLLTDLGNYLAKKMGFELPTIDYSNLGDGISSVTENADEATDAVKETAKEIQRLAGFDEINVLQSSDNNNSGTNNDTANGFDLNIDLPEYDFLKDVNKQTDDLYKKIKKKLLDLFELFKKNKKIIKTIAELIVGMWALGKLKKFITFISDLWNWFKDLSIIKGVTEMVKNFVKAYKGSTATTFLGKLKDGFAGIRNNLGLIKKIGVGTVFGTIGGIASYDFFKKLSNNTFTWGKGLLDIVGMVGSIAAAFAIGGPIAGCITIVGELTGAFFGLKGTLDDTLYLFDNGGVKISDVTDLFSEQYDTVIDTSKKLEEYQQTIADNKQTIKTATKNVENFNKAFGDTKFAMSESDLDEIKGQFDTISQAIKDNLGLATQSILDSFSTKISDVAEQLGIDLDEAIGSIKGISSALGTNVDKANATVQDYWQMIFDGITPTEKQKAEYERANSYLLESMKSETSEIEKAKGEMAKAIDFSTLDLENPETFEKSIDTLKNKTNEALQAAKSTYDNSMKSVNELYVEAQRQYKYGYIDDSAYAMATKTYNDTKKLLEADYKQTVKDIKNDDAAITGSILYLLEKEREDQAKYWAGVDLHLWERGEKYNQAAVDEFIKTNKYQWENAYEIQKYNFSTYGHKTEAILQKFSDETDIKPNKEAGSAWLNQMAKNGEAALPSVIAKSNSLIDTWTQNNIKMMSYNIDKLGLSSNSKFKTMIDYESLMKNGQKVSETLGTGIATGEGSITSELKKISMYPDSILWVDCTTNGKNVGETFAKGINQSATSIKNALKNAVDSAVSKVSKTSFAINLDIKAILQSGLNNVAKVATAVKGGSVGKFASGGFVPKSANLFMTHENGIPEMVGRIGNQTAVANNDQIVTSIRYGVADGVKQAMSDYKGDTQGDTYVFIDSEEVSARIEQRSRNKNKRTGGRA